MRFDSFLENLYFGNLDHDKFHYYETPDNDPVVAEIISEFKNVAASYSPDDLEKLGRVPDDLLDQLREIGFFGLMISKEYGGQGLDLYQYLSVVEQIISVDMALGLLSLAHLSIGVKGIMLYGNEEQKRKYLPLAASGKMIFCYALTEPLIGSDAKNIKTAAELSDDGNFYIINGTKTFITNANYSGGLTVFAQMDKEKPGTLGAFVVETNWAGVTIGKDMDKMGLKASSTASIQLNNVRVPKENLLGQPGDGFKIAMTILNYGRLALGAASSGMLALSCHDMLARARTRVQFDMPIINFELVQEKIVKAFVYKEVVSAMTNFTAGFLVKNPVAQIAIESSHCKMYGTNRAWETLYDAMQLAGGAGYLSSQPYEKRMRDFRVATIFEGTTEIHLTYPPLSLARTFSKMLKKKSESRFGQLLAIYKFYLGCSNWKINSDLKSVRSSAKQLKSCARLYRKLFLRSFVSLGAQMPFHEYLLRRLTVISYYAYGLSSLIAKMQYLQLRGADVSNLETILEFFREEARIECKKNYRFESDYKELIQSKIVSIFKK